MLTKKKKKKKKLESILIYYQFISSICNLVFVSSDYLDCILFQFHEDTNEIVILFFLFYFIFCDYFLTRISIPLLKIDVLMFLKTDQFEGKLPKCEALRLLSSTQSSDPRPS